MMKSSKLKASSALFANPPKSRLFLYFREISGGFHTKQSYMNIVASFDVSVCNTQNCLFIH